MNKPTTARRTPWMQRVLKTGFADESVGSERLPDFLIIGAPKAGTSALATYLMPHPQVFIPPLKELHYFDRDYDRGPAWYRAQFAAAGSNQLAGEATPRYLSKEQVPARIAELVPSAKLIAILREPVDRAYSEYWMVRAKFPVRGHASFEDLFRAYSRGDPVAGHPPYFEKSRYLPQLQRYVEHFPRENLLVLIFEELVADASAAFSTVCGFLGVDDSFVPPNLGEVVNPTNRQRSERFRRIALRLHVGAHLPPKVARWIAHFNKAEGYPKLSPGLRAEIRDTYADEIAGLARWLGRDLDVWERTRR